MALSQETGRPRILLVVNVDWFFLSHRLPLAKEALRLGGEIYVIAGDSGRSQAIRNEGLAYWPLPLSRSGTSPISDSRTLWYLIRTYRQLRPDLVHHVSIKPVIYGSLAARFARVGAVVNTISGLGYAFTPARRALLLRPVITKLYKLALHYRRSRTIFQNADDREEFIELGLVPSELTTIIRGSGVDCERYAAKEEPEGEPIVMLPARMIWDKGIEEFVSVARRIRSDGRGPRFVLVGAPDPGNPRSLSLEQLQNWESEGCIEWWGHRENMAEVLSRASMVVLPTKYREGIPMVLLEAAACGRPLIASDAPGCREIVRPDANGFLVPQQDPASLERAIRTLLESRDMRQRFGAAGRDLVVKEFAQELVLAKTFSLYNGLLDGRWPPLSPTDLVKD